MRKRPTTNQLATLLRFIFLFLSTVCTSTLAFACPAIRGLKDINCDGKIKIAVLGDSISAGSRGNLRSRGSYVKRLHRYFPFAKISNLGFPGLDTTNAAVFLRRRFPANPYGVKKSLLDSADFVLIQLGVNDYFTSTDPQDTIKRLKIINTLVQNYVVGTSGVIPLTAFCYITPVVGVTETRAKQVFFVEDLNRALAKASDESFPVGVKFNKLSTSEIFRDGLHPSTEGHDHMTKILAKYLRVVLAETT